jgi:pSer/pThr/pTyr-binding forkhead associated (FHA) protein
VIRKLVLTGGTHERELQLVGRIVVGRDPACEVSHDDSLLSRRHAEFLTTGDTVTVRDLGSRNGVYVNGARALEQVLTPGDVIQIGPLRAQFVVEDASMSLRAEELEGDRTAVIRKAFAVGQAELGGPLAAVVGTVDFGSARGPSEAPEGCPPQAHRRASARGGGAPRAVNDDDEVTRMVPAPRPPSAEKPMPNAYAAKMLLDDDAPTQFISASAPAARPAPAAAGSSLSVVVPVMSLAMIVLASTAIPLLLGAASVWLALPTIIAMGGSYLVASSIHRRMLEAAAAERER